MKEADRLRKELIDKLNKSNTRETFDAIQTVKRWSNEQVLDFARKQKLT